MENKHFVKKKNTSITFRVFGEVKDAALRKAYKENRSLGYIVEKALMKELGILDPEMQV